MKSLNLTCLARVCCVPLIWLLAIGSLVASDHPEGGDGRGLSIKLEVPWTTFRIGETFVYSYTLRNASDKPVSIGIPVEKYGLGAITGGQAFLEAFRTEGRKVENPTYDVSKATWPPRTEVDEEPQAWTWLPPGHQLTWNQNQLWAGHYGVGSYQSFEELRGHWLTGPKQWISSDPIKVAIVSVPQSQWTEMFKVQWTSTDYRGGPRERVFYRIPIKGRMYLFSSAGTRIAEVESNDQFEHSVDKDGTNLEITIKSALGNRKVYFHLAQGYTRDTPWPVGPASLFAPKPEPIPPAELAELRKKLGLAPDGSVLRTAAPSTTAKDTTPPYPKIIGAWPFRYWLWLAACVVGFSVLLLFLKVARRL